MHSHWQLTVLWNDIYDFDLDGRKCGKGRRREDVAVCKEHERRKRIFLNVHYFFLLIMMGGNVFSNLIDVVYQYGQTTVLMHQFELGQLE